MTIADTVVKNVYDGDGVTTEFPYTFPIAVSTDIKVFVTDADGMVTEKTTNFEVDTVDEFVKYPTVESELDPLPSGVKITIIRATAVSQEFNFSKQGNFSSQDIEDALDSIVTKVQELNEKVARCLKYSVDTVPISDDIANYIVTMQEVIATAISAATIATQALANTWAEKQTFSTGIKIGNIDFIPNGNVVEVKSGEIVTGILGGTE